VRLGAFLTFTNIKHSKKKKLLPHDMHAPANRHHPRPFKRLIWRLLAVTCCLPRYCWKSHPFKWMIGDLLKVTISFVFPFFSLPLGSTHWSLFLNVSILVFILLISTFFLDLFYKSFIYFQFSPLIKIYHIFFFQFRFLGLLVKVLLIFDFTIQSKFMMYYFFQLGPHFFFIFSSFC
jgi:hypothetical protein